jgi:pimeloyl-ACP methyl ester carboxylesterase
MPHAMINGINMYYQLVGCGFPLVMITGLSANKDWWPPEMIDNLKRKYTLVLFDNRGAGRTDAPDMAYSIPMLADDAAGLMEKLGLEQGFVFGFSMGGMIAQELTLNHPEKVAKLVLGCTTSGFRYCPQPPEVLQALIKPDYTLEDTARIMFPPAYMEASPDEVARFLERVAVAPIGAQAYVRQLLGCNDFDAYERDGDLKIPTLVLTGDQDFLIDQRNSEILARRIPGAKLIRYQGAGHGFFIQCHKEVTRALIDFLG